MSLIRFSSAWSCFLLGISPTANLGPISYICVNQRMKVFLRNTETGQFYAGPGQWTPEHSEALDFQGPDVALDAVSDSKLGTMEVVIHFEDCSFDLPMKIVATGV